MLEHQHLRIAVSLRLTGAFDPAEVTAALGLAPTAHWRAGQTGPAPKLPRKSDGWVLGLSTGTE
ncbi:DUF4279 domain-containing protein [Nocardia sp. NPDC050378]|uniref:DUF4279 domain-containing protein n=1 Tax=Nocardia sp. NPDC050378 TaxID=3155400 RepID=UPI0033CFD7A0